MQHNRNVNGSKTVRTELEESHIYILWIIVYIALFKMMVYTTITENPTKKPTKFTSFQTTCHQSLKKFHNQLKRGLGQGIFLKLWWCRYVWKPTYCLRLVLFWPGDWRKSMKNEKYFCIIFRLYLSPNGFILHNLGTYRTITGRA